MGRVSRRGGATPLRTHLFGLAAAAAVVLALAVVCIGYWPGIMIDDARWQYQQSVDDSYEDWHPPLMAWMWRWLMFIQPGPAPMLFLQLALLWAGIALISWWAIRGGRPRLALAVALTGWLPAPLALSGTVTKDCLMAGALLTATGLALTMDLAGNRLARASARVAAFGFILFAAALRLNAILACVPLLLAILPRGLTRTRARLLAAGMAGVALLFAVTPAINAAVQAEHTDVDLSLIIFDLGGITAHSGINVFPDLNVRDPVTVNRRCYDPIGWDSYSSWATKPCPLGFEPFQNAKDEDDLSPTRLWLSAILHHPLAYAEHRLTHFNLSTAFLVHSGPAFTAWSQSVPNPWGYSVRSKIVIPALTKFADAGARTPIGWPIFWISVSLASLVGGLLTHAPKVVTAVACSSFLYGLGYLLCGVAVGMRYYFWTISGGAVAAVLVGAELVSRKSALGTPRLAAVSAIAAGPAMLAIAARILL